MLHVARTYNIRCEPGCAAQAAMVHTSYSVPFPGRFREHKPAARAPCPEDIRVNRRLKAGAGGYRPVEVVKLSCHHFICEDCHARDEGTSRARH